MGRLKVTFCKPYSGKRALGKRGQVQDLLVFGVVAFVIGVVILIGYRILTDVNDNFAASDQIPQHAKDRLDSFTGKFSTLFDAVYVLALLLLGILVVVSVFLIDTHPVFMALSIPAFLVVLFVNVVLANALDDIGNTSNLASLYAEFEMMQFVASHWIAMMSILGFLTITVFYAKRSGSG